MSSLLKPWRFTADQYHQMGEAGILRDDDRTELIEGVITCMSPIGSPHAGCVFYLSDEFHRQAGSQAIVSVQSPVRLSEHSEPEPDIALLRPRVDYYRRALPGPEDVLLVVEVSDSTLTFDRRVKLPLYAGAGIPEVWIANLNGECFEVHTDPHEGRYLRREVLPRGAVLSPLALPAIRIAVDDALGERESAERG